MQQDRRSAGAPSGPEGQADRPKGGQTSVATIEQAIEPTVAAMGYAVVRVAVSGGSSPVLQVMVERGDGKSMTVEDCADISRAVSAILDVEDPIAGAYRLEISSPGIDRPLVKPADFERFAGEVAKVETTLPVEGRKRFQGRLLGLRQDAVALKLDDGAEVALPLNVLRRAKLVLTDELLRAHYARQQQEQKEQTTMRKTGA
jgi:ribosome maturation factor RimP